MSSEQVKKKMVLYIVSIGKNGKPNGHIYAENMADIDIDPHQTIIEIGKHVSLWTEYGFFLTLQKEAFKM